MMKLFVVTQKDVYLPDSPIITQLNPYTDTGINISQMENYSELRAHYWVWKNESMETDIVGFYQFRRYLNLTTRRVKLPYTIRKYPKINNLQLNTIIGSDIIAPIPEYTGMTVWERYSKDHRRCDLELVSEIIMEKYPEYAGAAKVYLNGKSEYYGNLYIMRRAIFDCYCGWLFGILEEFDERAKNIPARTQGYMAERLFGIWFTKMKENGALQWKVVPRVHFWGYDDEKHHLRYDRFVNFLLPPGTHRRALIKKYFM